MKLSEVSEGTEVFFIDTSVPFSRMAVNHSVVHSDNTLYITALNLNVTIKKQEYSTSVTELDNKKIYYFLSEDIAKISLFQHCIPALQNRVKSYIDIVEMDSRKVKQFSDDLKELKEKYPEEFI